MDYSNLEEISYTRSAYIVLDYRLCPYKANNFFSYESVPSMGTEFSQIDIQQSGDVHVGIVIISQTEHRKKPSINLIYYKLILKLFRGLFQ